MNYRTMIASGITILALGLVGVMPVLAQSQTPSEATHLTLSAPAKGAKGHLTLRATLSDEAGKPVTGKLVSFYEHVQLFGGRDALLGSATTDSTGYVAIDYQPVETGSQTIKVQFSGDDELATSSASSNITVNDATPLYSPEPLPLAGVRQWLPLGLASLVLATWAVLLGVSLRTIRGIRSARYTGEQSITQELKEVEEPALVFAHSLEGRDS
jgi:Big-like domain-containing protein